MTRQERKHKLQDICAEHSGWTKTMIEEIMTLFDQALIEARVQLATEIAEDMTGLDNYHEHDDSVALYLKKKWTDRIAQLTKPEKSDV